MTHMYRWIDNTGYSRRDAMNFPLEQDDVRTYIPREAVTFARVPVNPGSLREVTSFRIEHMDVVISGRISANADWNWGPYGVTYDDLERILDQARVLQAWSYDSVIA